MLEAIQEVSGIFNILFCVLCFQLHQNLNWVLNITFINWKRFYPLVVSERWNIIGNGIFIKPLDNYALLEALYHKFQVHVCFVISVQDFVISLLDL